MVELAKKASTDKRILERPIDIVGDSMVKRIKFIESQNSTAGKKVNEVAKLLRGQAVDANAIAQRADDLIDDLGIIKTTEGKFDFSNSVFKNTPEIQKKLTKFLAEVPTGQADAYDVHIFKKSIDELVDYGTKGEGGEVKIVGEVPVELGRVKLTQKYKSGLDSKYNTGKKLETTMVTVTLKDGRKGQIPSDKVAQFLKDNPGAKKE